MNHEKGDIVWSIKFEIASHLTSYDYIPFHTEEINTDTFYPKRTWPTKREAIDAMIDSLHRIQEEDRINCEHEHDGKIYGEPDYLNAQTFPRHKCIKCNALY